MLKPGGLGLSTSVPWVIKFGGSLAHDARFRSWLDVLGTSGAVIVPGGGVFADAVRTLQGLAGFGDPLAHRLAIQGMRLYGEVLLELAPSFRPASQLEDVSEQLKNNMTSLWLPDAHLEFLQTLEASWAVTSDSIALALAKALEIPRVLFVKSVDSWPKSESLARAIRLGTLDPALPDILEGSEIQLFCVGPRSPEALEKGLEDPRSWFTELLP